MMTSLSSRHNGWFGMMPRSRQISAMTAPIGRRRDLCGDLLGGGGGACGLGGARLVLGRRGLRPVRCVQTGSVADEASFECASAVQPLGDADENERDVAGAEVARVRGGVAPVERRGEFAAVVDEFADEGEDATDPTFLGRAGRVGIGRRVWGGGGPRVWHERNKNIEAGWCKGIFSSR
jgi:hypothetical protein